MWTKVKPAVTSWFSSFPAFSDNWVQLPYIVKEKKNRVAERRVRCNYFHSLLLLLFLRNKLFGYCQLIVWSTTYSTYLEHTDTWRGTIRERRHQSGSPGSPFCLPTPPSTPPLCFDLHLDSSSIAQFPPLLNSWLSWGKIPLLNKTT